MTDDLLARLRNYKLNIHFGSVGDEAADEIERLRARAAGLKRLGDLRADGVVRGWRQLEVLRARVVELEQDKARLDWASAHPSLLLEMAGTYYGDPDMVLRATIDAARKGK